MSEHIERPNDDHAWAAEHVASYLASGLALADRVRMRGHLKVCAECKQAVEELDELDAQMRDLFADASPSPTLETRTVEALRTIRTLPGAKARRAAWSWPMKAMLVAASVMLL